MFSDSSEDKNYDKGFSDYALTKIKKRLHKVPSIEYIHHTLYKVKNKCIDFNRGYLINAVKSNDIENVEDVLEYYETLFNTCSILIDDDKDEEGRYPFYCSVVSNNIEITKMIISYAHDNKIELKINRKGPHGWYPFLIAVSGNSIEMVSLIIEYAEKNGIKLDINEKMMCGWYPLLIAVRNNKIDMVHIIMKYAHDHNIILKINDKNDDGFSPFQYSIYKNNTELVNLLMLYATNNRIELNINEKDEDGNSPLLTVIKNKNIEMLRSILNYAKDHNINLKINSKNNHGNYPLLLAAINNSTEIAKLIIEYAIENDISLKIDEENEDQWTVLLKTISNKNIKFVQLIINYANNHNILLNVKDKPFYYAVLKNKLEIAELIIRYADRHRINLNINCKNEAGYYPLLLAVDENNVRMARLIIKYANKHHLPLIYNEVDVKRNKEIYRLLRNFRERNETLFRKTANVHKNNKEKEFKEMSKERIAREQNPNDDTYKIINAVKRNDYTTVNNTIIDYIPYNIKKIDIVDDRGWSALHWACFFGNEDLVDLLLENNADLTKKTIKGLGDDKFKGKTARQIAKLRGHNICARSVIYSAIKRGLVSTFQFSMTVYQVIPK